MKSNKRSVRRHHYNRLKKSRAHYWGYEGMFRDYKRMNHEILGQVISTPQRCSCSVCGNQRKYYGKTLKEKIYFLSTEEELLDYLT